MLKRADAIRRKSFLGALLLPAVLMSAVLMPADAVAANRCEAVLPWVQLDYQVSRFGLTASSQIRIESVAASFVKNRWQSLGVPSQPPFALLAAPDHKAQPRLWQITANNAIASNQEKVVSWLGWGDLQLVMRERLSHGGVDSRFKAYLYQPQGVYRIRKEPAAGQSADQPASWPTTSAKQLPLVEKANRYAAWTSVGALMLQAAFAAADPAGPQPRYLMVNDQRYFGVQLRLRGYAQVTPDYQLEIAGKPGQKIVRQTLSARQVELTATPLSQAGEDDFEFMGLSGMILLLVDPATGLPLQVQGDAPRFGRATIQLVHAAIPDAALRSCPLATAISPSATHAKSP